MASSSHTDQVQQYYDHNTTRFLKLGKHGGSLNIHQALWADGVETQEEAVSYSNRLVLEEVNAMSHERSGRPIRVLDLGCGVGASLLYLAEHFVGEADFQGVTLSPVQAQLAQERRGNFPNGEKCTFQAADFLNLPQFKAIDVAYAIEAFVHAADPGRFFQQIGRQLAAGGQLVLVDDGLSERGTSPEQLSRRERQWLADFRAGWLAQSLIGLPAAKALAEQAGLKLRSVEDLTPIMDIGRPRDQWIGLMIGVAGPLMRRSTYFKSLTGGYAKQQLLKCGVVQYRKLVFEKEG